MCVWQPSLEEVSLDYSNHPNVRMKWVQRRECTVQLPTSAAPDTKPMLSFTALSLSVSFSPFYLSKNRPAWGRQLTLACSHELTLMQGVLKDWKINSTQWCSKAVEPFFSLSGTPIVSQNNCFTKHSFQKRFKSTIQVWFIKVSVLFSKLSEFIHLSEEKTKIEVVVHWKYWHLL